MYKSILLKKTKSEENFLIKKFKPIDFSEKLSRNRSNKLFLNNNKNRNSCINNNSTSYNFNSTNYDINNLKIYSWSTKYLLNNSLYSQESKDINSNQKKLEKLKKQFRINPVSPFSYNKYRNYSLIETNSKEKKTYHKIYSIDSDIKRREFLYKKIFYYWQDKRNNFKKKEKKIINNKLNIEYAENENIFDEKLKKINNKLISQGKKIKHFSGPSFAEIKLKETIQKVQFMKSVADYSYPKYVINKIREIDKLLKIKNKEFFEKNYKSYIEKVNKRKLYLNSMYRFIYLKNNKKFKNEFNFKNKI